MGVQDAHSNPSSDGHFPGPPNDYFSTRSGVRCAGAHLILDIRGAKRIDDPGYVEDTLRRCADAARAQLLSLHLHQFDSGAGLSGVALLAESHISIHTWPERSYAAIDIFMCGRCDPATCIPVLRERFAGAEITVIELLRGQNA